LRVDCLSTTGAASFPLLTVFWDTSHAVEKDHQLDEALAPLNVGVHIAPSAQAVWLAYTKAFGSRNPEAQTRTITRAMSAPTPAIPQQRLSADGSKGREGFSGTNFNS
jgi:hypothetical protein